MMRWARRIIKGIGRCSARLTSPRMEVLRMPSRTTLPLDAKLFRKRLIDPSSGCWLWTGWRLPRGYGHIQWKNKTWLVHRAAFSFFNNAEIPEGLEVLHRCDNPPCFNPGHLFLGTQKDNIQDALSKGRVPHLIPQDVCEAGHSKELGGPCNACRREAYKKRSQKWRDEQRAKTLKWQQENRELTRAYGKKSYYKNHEESRRKANERKARNREALNAKERERYRRKHAAGHPNQAID